MRTAFLALLLVGCGERAVTQNDVVTSNPANQAATSHAGMDTPIPAAEIPGLIRRARAGDNRAAESLGYNYGLLNQRVDEKRWYRIAADRGDCSSMSQLMGIAYNERDRATYDIWNSRMREHQCTLGKMLPMAARDMDPSTPMWDDQPELLWNSQR